MAGIDEIKKEVLLRSVVGGQEPNLGHLSGEILKEIVDRIPIESLTKMNLLSKGWNRLISDRLRSKGWHRLTDRLRSKPQPSSIALLPGIHPGTPPCSSSSPVMKQQALPKAHQPYHESHSVDAVDIERERIRYLAILEHCLPKRLFSAYESIENYPSSKIYPSSNESNTDGVCPWCLQNFNHATRDECPAGDLTFYPISHYTKAVTPPPLPKRENGEVKIYIPGEVNEADVRKLFEPFWALRRVKLRELRHEDEVVCVAVVGFVNFDDAGKAVKKLKGEGYNIRLYD